MKIKLLVVPAVLVVGLLAFSSNAYAILNYFDAQIHDIVVGKDTIDHNTEWADGTLFTTLPNPDDAAGNWTLSGAGDDGLWRQRAFENPDASTNPTIYESRGQFNGPNTENLPTLKTTINVPLADQGASRSVWAMFWSDGAAWQIAASLWNQRPGLDPDDDLMPLFFGGGSQSPTGYVYRAYNAAEGAPGNAFEVETNASITSDSGRVLWGAFLGDVTLGSTLTVYTGDGPPLADDIHTGDGAHNHRTWFDGIGYGDPLGIDPLPDLPEPASLMLLGFGLAGLGLARRRRS